MNPRTARIVRESRETRITVSLRLDEPGPSDVATGLPFLDHMLDAFACHGRFALTVEAEGDLNVDPHHLVEDCGIVLGQAIAKSLRQTESIRRSGCFSFPMDGSLAHVALDLCGRPNLIWNVPLQGRPLGTLDPLLLRDFFKGWVDGLRATLHVNVPYLDNDHHALEAVFKALGRCLSEAVQPLAQTAVLSTKGLLDD